MAWYSSFLGGSGSSGGSGSGFDWSGLILAGVSAYSQSRSSSNQSKNDAKTQKEIVGLQGAEARRTMDFEKSLDRYYSQMDKRDKRLALDTYGSFSRLRDYAPAGYTLPAVPVVPDKPKA
jgi:hypothetical protein